MSSNLVQIVGQIFGAQMIARIAASLGINPTLAQALANAAVPAVLAALGNLAASPAGAQKIADQIKSQDSDILGSLVNSIGGANQTSFLSSGSGLLSSLLGGKAGGIADALARYTGAQPEQARNMLGVVTPATFGALAQQDPEIWSSGAGITSLFDSQRSAITSAIPADLGAALGATGLFSALPGMGQQAASAVSHAGAAAASAASSATSAAASAASSGVDAARRAGAQAEAAASGIPGWLKIALPVALIAALAWFLMPGKPVPQAVAPAPSATATTAATQLADFARQTNVAVAGVASSLAGVTDAASARAAQAKLAETTGDLEKLSGSFAKLPGEVRSAVAAPMNSALGSVREQIARVLALPGVADILKPTLDKALAALNGFKP